MFGLVGWIRLVDFEPAIECTIRMSSVFPAPAMLEDHLIQVLGTRCILIVTWTMLCGNAFGQSGVRRR